MKIIALAAAGLLAAGTCAATPADAQRHGWNDWRGWNDGRNWDRGRGWNGNRGYGRPRVRCQIVRGWYGPERQCWRVR